MDSSVEAAGRSAAHSVVTSTDAAACLAAVMLHFGAAAPFVDPAGGTLLDLYETLASGDLEVHAYEGTVDGLRDLVGPSILLLDEPKDGVRPVVCYGLEAGSFVVLDVGSGKQRYTASELVSKWTTRAMLHIAGVRSHTERRYRAFDVMWDRFGRARACVRARQTESIGLVSDIELRHLLATGAFRTARAHEASLRTAVRARDSRGDARSVSEMVQRWIGDGLLVDNVRLQKDVRGCGCETRIAARRENRVTVIGIPTRNRPKAAMRALRSYLLDLRAHGRQLRISIADGSGARDRQELRSGIEQLRVEFGTRIDHLDDAWKRRTIDRLARSTECPRTTLTFALFGHPACLTHFGANRNALLLDSVGELAVQVDDDTLVPVSPVRDSRRGLDVSSAFDPNFYRFDERLDESQPAGPVDFVGLHEDLLGRHAASILADYAWNEIGVDRLEPPLLRRLAQGDSTIGLSFLGTVGDTGSATNAWKLFLEGESLARLLDGGYDGRVRSREGLRTVAQRTVSSGTFCSGMNLGLDHRGTLAPFMPSGRNEDGAFSAVMAACFPQTLRGFREGFVLHHVPVDRRDPYARPVRFEGLRSNDLILLLAQQSGASRSSWVSPGLEWLGERLYKMARLAQVEFDEMCRDLAVRNVSVAAIQVEQSIARYARCAPEFGADLCAYLGSLETYVVGDAVGIPTDLQGSERERSALFRDLVGLYGELLLHWPDIIRCGGSSYNIDRAAHGTTGTTPSSAGSDPTRIH